MVNHNCQLIDHINQPFSESWSTKGQEDFNAQDDDCSDNSEFPSTPDTINTISTEDTKQMSDISYDDAMYGDDNSSALVESDYYDDLEDQVFEYDPRLDHSSMPESRFLDPKDFLSPRYADFKLLSNGAVESDYYDDEDYDPNMSDDHYNYFPSEDDEESEYYSNHDDVHWSMNDIAYGSNGTITFASSGIFKPNNEGQASGMINSVNNNTTP